jgi:hypothetical protein
MTHSVRSNYVKLALHCHSVRERNKMIKLNYGDLLSEFKSPKVYPALKCIEFLNRFFAIFNTLLTTDMNMLQIQIYC